MPCDRGALRVSITLAPTMPPTVQFFEVSRAPTHAATAAWSFVRRADDARRTRLAPRTERGWISRVFLLSPARSDGRRAKMLLNPRAEFSLAVRLREPDGAEIGEVFSFLSKLYFRGKLTYAREFAAETTRDVLARSS